MSVTAKQPNFDGVQVKRKLSFQKRLPHSSVLTPVRVIYQWGCI